MDYGAFRTFDLRDICITEFDDAFEKYRSINTPLSRLPRIHALGIISQTFELYGRHNSHDSVQECHMPSEHWVIQLPAPISHSFLYYREHPEGSKHTLLTAPHQEFTRHIAAQTPAMALVFREANLEQLFSQHEQDILHTMSNRILRRNLNLQKLQQISFQCANLLRLVTVGNQLRPAPDLHGQFTDIAIDSISLTLEAVVEEPRICNRERVLTSALEYIRQNYTREMRLLDIVRHAHTTTRTLQLVFKQQFDLTPLQFIKRYRLARFHRGLRQYGTVTEAAIYSGLRHMGRLPDHYRSIFGENPGDYLTRKRDQLPLMRGTGN